MGLPRKKTRNITVNGVKYRWAVSQQYEYKWGLCIIVEKFDAPAQQMVTWVDPESIVTSSLVNDAITYALSHGWTPGEKGGSLHFHTENITGDCKKIHARPYV